MLASDPSRPQDEIDLNLLLGSADRATIDAATEALRWITDRGYHRGRDLLALLQERHKTG